MTRLLVSVRDASEARLAVDAGVDLIDLKEPNRGSLGAVDFDTLREVIEVVAGRVPLSAALGELVDITPAQVSALPKELSYAKVGLAGCASLADWPNRLGATYRALPDGVVPVAVIYADGHSAEAPPADAVLAVAKRLSCGAVLVDTFDKSQGGLFAHFGPGEIGHIVTTCRKLGILVVLAGSLTLETIPWALEFEPDFVAVRGVACAGSRTGALDADRLRQIVGLGVFRGNPRPAATINVG